MQQIAFVAPLIAIAVLMLVVHIGAQSAAALAARGVAWNAGPRDDASAQRTGAFEGRAGRALRNYLESFPAFGFLALTLALLGRADDFALIAAWIWLGARALYLMLYLGGVAYLRSLVWFVSILALLAMIARILF